MAKVATYVLILLCVLAAFWGMSDKSEVSPPEVTTEGESLKLLYELTDAELGLLALPEGAGDLSEEVAEPEPITESDEIVDALLVEALPEPTVEPVIEPVVEPICMSVGELRNSGDAKILESQLRSLGVEVFPVTRIIEELGPYMVYIQPKSSADEALEVVASLRTNRVESIIIRDGPYENGVSLGVFRSDENSAELTSRIRNLGYDVRRRRMSVETELFSFLLSGSELASMEDDFWEEFRSDFEGIEVLQKSCEEVASASNFQ